MSARRHRRGPADRPGRAAAVDPVRLSALDGRPAPLLQDIFPLHELRGALNEVMQQITAQGMTVRHQPLRTWLRPPQPTAQNPLVDPRYAAAQDALGEGDFDRGSGGIPEALGTPIRPTPRRRPGSRWQTAPAHRRHGGGGRRRRPRRPTGTTSTPRRWPPNSTCSAGRSEEAFGHLIELVRRTSGDKDRNAAREHLIGLFAAVGNDDPRVLKGRPGPRVRAVLIPAQVTRTRGELAIGVWCVLLGAGLFVWLGADLVSTDVDSGWAVVARFAAGCFWWALAASMLLQRWHRLGLLAAATCVAVLLLALAGGLLLDPGGFVRPGGVAPHTTTQARAVGAVVLLVLVAGGGWLGRRRASDD